MTRPWACTAFVAWIVASCARGDKQPEARYVTTAGAIAVANLDAQIAQRGNEPGVEDLLLARARFLGDYDALARAVSMAEGRSENGADLLRRARTRSAEHRFAGALNDIAAAERTGANAHGIIALRGSILVATGRAHEAVSELEAAVLRHPDLASRSALAGAYAAVGRFVDADRLYAEALAGLTSTSPFPFASLYFARAIMWSEQVGDSVRAADFYEHALVYVPEFVTANVHLAELEAARGDLALAIARLERVSATTSEPEAIGLLGQLYLRVGDAARGRREIVRARHRFESLLARHPLAFADHAAEFYLGPGADVQRAWTLASLNLANRQTVRAIGLAIRAAEAAGHVREACVVMVRYGVLAVDALGAAAGCAGPFAKAGARRDSSVE